MKLFIRITTIILLCITCIFVFYFSHQPGNISRKTSGKVINYIINLYTKTKQLTDVQKETLHDKMQTIIRKLAHFSVYTLIGFLTMIFLSTYKFSLLKTTTITTLTGLLYAISDEYHQSFIPRQKC